MNEWAALAGRFTVLFAGRTDVWGAVHGECMRTQLTDELVYGHLFGEGSVGVYPLVGHDDGTGSAWYCKWGCVDIDEGHDRGHNIARNLISALSALGITGFVEKTKGKGYHVWVFCQSWERATTVQHALRIACQVANYTPREVNPKQTTLEAGQLGNYVNLPYASGWVDSENPTRFVYRNEHPHDPLALEEFLTYAEAALVPRDVLEAAAKLYRPPKASCSIVFKAPQRPPNGLNGLAGSIAYGELLPSLRTGLRDRSEALMRLAYACKEQGLDPSATLGHVIEMDRRGDMGKYANRPDAEERYRQLVEKAWR